MNVYVGVVVFPLEAFHFKLFRVVMLYLQICSHMITEEVKDSSQNL